MVKTNQKIDNKKQMEISIKENIIEVNKTKITISSKEVTQQKNALQILLNRRFNGDIVCEKTYPWLKTPTEIDETYQKVIESLINYRGDTHFARKGYKLRCDFVCESQKVIIEYDERQHFTMARKLSLEAYKKEIPLDFDADLWIKACIDIKAKDNNPRNRDEFRAFYDSVRDIEAFRHGYKLIRIMHSQNDWESENAYEVLDKILDDTGVFNKNLDKENSDIEIAESNINEVYESLPKNYQNEILNDNAAIKKTYEYSILERKRVFNIKVGLWLQNYDDNYRFLFKRMVKQIKGNCDLLVFPEVCYFPGIKKRYTGKYEEKYLNDRHSIAYKVNEFSKKLGIPVIYGGMNFDGNGEIYNIYVNPFAKDDETVYALYIKHTATETSAFDLDYDQSFPNNFPIIKYKNARIGMTICYDCNHALFSRMYGLNDVDIIINSTGGNVNYQKWQHFNKVRAIENNCFSLCVMGDNVDRKQSSYTFAFTPQGGELSPSIIIGNDNDEEMDESGNIYVYSIDSKTSYEEKDINLDQKETNNKKVHYFFDVEHMEDVLDNCERLKDSTYIQFVDKYSLVFILIENEDIMEPEVVSNLLFNSILNNYKNKAYCLVNRWTKKFDSSFFENQLSDILKVRAVENYIAVIHMSEYGTKCYQSGYNKNVQCVAYDEKKLGYGLDLSRMSGPENRWRANKQTQMKTSWRKGYEKIIEYCINEKID